MKLKKILVVLLVPIAYICTNSFAADVDSLAKTEEFEKETAELKKLHALLDSTLKESDSFHKELDRWVDLQDKHQWPDFKKHLGKKVVQLSENAQKELDHNNNLMTQHKKRFFLNRDAFKHAALAWANRATHSNTADNQSSFSSTSTTGSSAASSSPSSSASSSSVAAAAAAAASGANT